GESVVHAEVVRERDRAELARLRENVERVLDEVRLAVEDWPAMRSRTEELSQELEHEPPPVDPNEIEEVREFLKWVPAHHFTFLGYREYDLVIEGDEAGLKAVPESGLGILRNASP